SSHPQFGHLCAHDLRKSGLRGRRHRYGWGLGQTTYKMGWAMPLSGSEASLGRPFTTFAEYGVEAVNERYAAEGFQIELVTEDTQATAEVGVTAVTKLATVESVPVVFTAWSAVVKAMAPTAESLGVGVVNNGANSPELAGASEMLVNFFPLSSVSVSGVANYMATKGGKQRAAVIYIDNATGQGAAQVYKKEFEAAGGQVVAMESLDQRAIDASAQVAKVKAANPDTIQVQVLLGEAPVVLKELHRQGVDAQITTYAGPGQATSVRKASGEAMNGVIYTDTTAVTPEDPKFAALVERYKQEEGQAPPGLAYMAYMYDSPFLFAEAIMHLREQGKEVTGENLVDAVRAGTFEVPLQRKVDFTEQLTVEKPVTLKRITDPSAPTTADKVVATVE
ncbi:MAG: ABC transporter substrate-binding protein, partial [Pseudonocardiaceae bacterium]|nr:ABC transporter substrate-binding protein [Pseudonocardiaceae bacterium]